MRILVTGAQGYIGQLVTKALLEEESNHLIITDIIEPRIPAGSKHPGNATSIQANLITSSSNVVDKGLDAAVILHGVMSGGAEANFDLGYDVNARSTWVLLDELIKTCPGIRVVYASSMAVYGRPVPEKGVTEADIPTPEVSYGAQKIICETLINDYTRRGKINGFSLRFPTISVRAGAPSPAVTAFLSGIIREPMNGQECIVPLKDRSWRHWMSSPKTLIKNILLTLTLPRDALPPHRRMVNVPGFAVSIQEMLDALEEVGGKDKLALVKEKEDPSLMTVLNSWADDFDNSLALSLGMQQDTSFLQSVRDYAETLQESKRNE